MPSEEQATELIENCEMHDFYDWNGQSYKLANSPIKQVHFRFCLMGVLRFKRSNLFYDFRLQSKDPLSEIIICRLTFRYGLFLFDVLLAVPYHDGVDAQNQVIIAVGLRGKDAHSVSGMRTIDGKKDYGKKKKCADVDI